MTWGWLFNAWQLSYDQRVALSFLVFNVNGWLKMPNLHLKQLGFRVGSKGATQWHSTLSWLWSWPLYDLKRFPPFSGLPLFMRRKVGPDNYLGICWHWLSIPDFTMTLNTTCSAMAPLCSWHCVWWHSAPFQTHPLPSFLVVSCTVDSQICASSLYVFHLWFQWQTWYFVSKTEINPFLA